MFSTQTLAGGLSLECKGPQISSRLQDFSEYTCRYQQCRGLYGFDSSFDFQFLQSLFYAIEEYSWHANYYSYHRHPQLF